VRAPIGMQPLGKGLAQHPEAFGPIEFRPLVLGEKFEKLRVEPHPVDVGEVILWPLFDR